MGFQDGRAVASRRDAREGDQWCVHRRNKAWPRCSLADEYLDLRGVRLGVRAGQVRLVRSIESGVFAAMKRVIHLPNDHKVSLYALYLSPTSSSGARTHLTR